MSGPTVPAVMPGAEPFWVIDEVDEAATRIREEVDQDANIILGATFDESLEGIIRVSVVATGIGSMPGEDATAYAEALRLAPNLEVARRSSRDYAVSARGFNGYQLSNKLLVMIDGRPVYTPLFAGVPDCAGAACSGAYGAAAFAVEEVDR